MKLIIVQRARLDTFLRLTEQFSDHQEVRVVWDQRKQQIRQRHEPHDPDRRRADRRQLRKSWDGRDYIVAYLADPSTSETQPRST